MKAERLEELMAGAAIDPRGVVFHAPWQARAFAIALTLCRRGRYDWEEFRKLLMAKVAAAPSDEYYRLFLRALEKLLAARQILSDSELAARVRELAPPPPSTQPAGSARRDRP